MARTAGPEAAGAQVMECRGYSADRSGSLNRSCADVGVALQTNKSLFVPDQHARVRGSVRFMTRTATLHPQRRVLESEGTALVAVALEAARLIGIDRSNGLR